MKNIINGFHIIIILLVVANLFNFYSVQSQSTFRIDIEEEEDIWMRPFIENSEGDYIGIINKRPIPSSQAAYRPHIYEVSKYGDITSKVISKPDTMLLMSRVMQINTSPCEYFIAGYGYQIYNKRKFHSFMKLDEDFNIIVEKYYYLSDDDITRYSSIIFQYQDSTFLYGANIDGGLTMYLFRLFKDLDSIRFKKYHANVVPELDSAGTIHGITYNHDSTDVLLHTHFAHYDPIGPESQCITIDEELNQIEVKYYPSSFSDNFTSKWLPGGSMISCGLYWHAEGPDDYKQEIQVYEFDSSLNVLNQMEFTNPDTVSYSAEVVALDFIDTSAIYVGGTHNKMGGAYSSQPSWYVIAQINTNLEIQYEKYIGGDTHYALYALTATSDGGVFLTGTKYDHTKPDNWRDAVLIKLNEEGLLTNLPGNNKVQIKDVLVYPNPGINFISVRTALKNCFIQLFDAKGGLVLSEALKNRINQIDVQHLSVGTYHYQIIQDNTRIVDYGTWIKH